MNQANVGFVLHYLIKLFDVVGFNEEEVLSFKLSWNEDRFG